MSVYRTSSSTPRRDRVQFTPLHGKRDGDTQARCPHHNVVHDWRIIDFDRSFRMDMEIADKASKAEY